MTSLGSRGAARRKRHERIRLRLSGTDARPRLAVFRSNKNIYAQVIDDVSGRTLAAASSLETGLRDPEGAGTKSAGATSVGRLVAERAKAAGVAQVVFDRAGYRYHGRVRSLAEAAREAGLDF
jgi:large subunit ribosomal protein L18